MRILGSSKRNPDTPKTTRCALRKNPVEADPEELVRQTLLCHMTGSLGYPKSLIVVEKELKHIPYLALHDKEIPERRADIICFGKGIHPEHELYPLLLIECKAVKLTPKVINQVTGYNHFLGSYFIAVANKEEIQTGWYDASSKKYQFVPYLPAYKDLMQAVTNP